jgi:hypothetical protein
MLRTEGNRYRHTVASSQLLRHSPRDVCRKTGSVMCAGEGTTTGIAPCSCSGQASAYRPDSGALPRPTGSATHAAGPHVVRRHDLCRQAAPNRRRTRRLAFAIACKEQPCGGDRLRRPAAAPRSPGRAAASPKLQALADQRPVDGGSGCAPYRLGVIADRPKAATSRPKSPSAQVAALRNKQPRRWHWSTGRMTASVRTRARC